MAIRTLLVPVDGTAATKGALSVAATISRQLSAHVDVLHVRADPANAVPLLGEGMSGAMIEEMYDLAERDAAEKAILARQAFDQFCAAHDFEVVDGPPVASPKGTASWLDETGRDDEVMARLGRLSDLILVARPLPDSDVALSMVLNAALFETRRPVLVTPPEPQATVGKRVAIAWNGNAEAASAAAAALPFLSAAKEVTVVTVATERTEADESQPLVHYLAWHEIEAASRSVDLGGRSVGQALLETCGDLGADLLVMGAYTHSRVREMIMGGVTRHVLAETTIPVLMSH